MTKSEQWQQHLNLWHASGLSQVAFCQQHNIAVHNFQYWRKRLSPKTNLTKNQGSDPYHADVFGSGTTTIGLAGVD
ncbi:IS66 family insertion sequence element accessory protein TnpA [Thalassolituus oleivorans]|uniref:IS66 family insertion sequence element accessory protein TnpA n=1 Tax=Thalassolituus oleivorans TaxID=187493 RepID=UPI00046CBFE8|nr:hypothetical protein [Thalassolituus oleivorans]